jgi:hypothetical protein
VTGAAALVRVDMSPMKPDSDMRRESVRLSLTCRCATGGGAGGRRKDCPIISGSTAEQELETAKQ